MTFVEFVALQNRCRALLCVLVVRCNQDWIMWSVQSSSVKIMTDLGLWLYALFVCDVRLPRKSCVMNFEWVQKSVCVAFRTASFLLNLPHNDNVKQSGCMKRIIYIIFLMLATGVGAQTPKSSTSHKASSTTSVRRKAAPQSRQRTTQQRRPVYRDVTYIINGNVNGYADGEWARLCIPTVHGLQAHDSVQVKDGKFHFKGMTKNVPHMQYVTIGEGM